MNHPWKCSKCRTVVFIPTGSNITGGVCTQQKRGCAGEISKMDVGQAALAREVLSDRGIAEQPWLTLVFATERPS